MTWLREACLVWNEINRETWKEMPWRPLNSFRPREWTESCRRRGSRVSCGCHEMWQDMNYMPFMQQLTPGPGTAVRRSWFQRRPRSRILCCLNYYCIILHLFTHVPRSPFQISFVHSAGHKDALPDPTLVMTLAVACLNIRWATVRAS